MEITIDRYLDDGKASLVTLGLRSRTTEMHSVLSALDAAQKAAVHTALTKAMDDIVAVMQPVAAGMPKT
ncbi:MAG: hypothetical protein JNL48_10415 [Acidobacteria bacterium]|nr:hypothetical protein [Acidobacteriota bacterium]